MNDAVSDPFEPLINLSLSNSSLPLALSGDVLDLDGVPVKKPSHPSLHLAVQVDR